MLQDLDLINSRIDLVALAERAGARLKQSGGEWRGNCPLHGGENPSGFVIYDDGKRWTCFSGDCGSGDALMFIMKHDNVGLLKAIEIGTGGVALSPEETLRIQAEQAQRATAELQKSIERAQAVLNEIQSEQIWLKYNEQLQSSVEGRAWWKGRGIPEGFQEIWQLGYETDRRIWVGNELRLPTATIPLFDYGWKCTNVKHRLIGAPDGVGKYRYEYDRAKSPIFIANPDLEKAETTVVVEGEIKAMVTYITLDQPNWQVIGMPGKSTKVDRIKPLLESSSDVYVCCDPDTGKLNEKIASELGAERCRIVDTPVKIDDYILACDISKNQLLTIFNQSRRIK